MYKGNDAALARRKKAQPALDEGRAFKTIPVDPSEADKKSCKRNSRPSPNDAASIPLFDETDDRLYIYGIMKKIEQTAIIALVIFSVLSVLSCASVPPAPPAEKAAAEKRSQKTDAKTAANEEYLRSVNNVDVTQKTFEDDKAAIMATIDELSSIMANGRYEAWLKYIDEESIRYWSNPKNLQRASKMLPVKGLRMNTLRDYFMYIFVPSRKGRKVDEIRYDSKTDVKAVQVSEDTDIIYYYFNKKDGKWLVRIPPID